MASTRYHDPVAPPPMPAAWTILRAYQAGAVLCYQNDAVAAPGRPGQSRRTKADGLELDGAGDTGDRAAADPDLAVVVAGHVHPPAAAKRRALAGDVWRGDPAGAGQPLRDRGVQAAGDRVLDRRAELRAEGADLQRLRRAGRVRPDHADAQVHLTRPDREHRVRAG